MTRLALVFAVVLMACSSAARVRVNSGLQESMNVTTDVVDPAYELAVISCDAAEGVAIDVNEDAGRARSAIEDIREKCDKIFGTFESLRELQETLRAAGDAYEAGDLEFSRLMALLAEARELAAESKRLVALFRAEHSMEIER